jgi:alpha-D-xyloside xylohydrolase
MTFERWSARGRSDMVGKAWLAIILLLPAPAVAAALPANVQRTAQGVVIRLPGGGVEQINVRGERILQVSYVPSGTLPSRQSLSVTASWPAAPAFRLTGKGTTMVLRTSRLAATVDTTTGLVSYAGADGRALTAEQAKTFGPSPSGAPGARQQVDTQFSSPATEGLFGLGQQQNGWLNDKGRQVTLDQFNQAGAGGSTAIPMMVSSRGYGVLWDTYSRAHFYGDANGGTAYRFSAESDNLVDYYFFYGPDLDSVIGGYRTATGTAPMFPLWSYGLFQSKDHYGSQDELLGVADAYRAAGIPVDAIVQDWQYWSPSPWGSHVLDPARYPDPSAMIDRLHAENVHTMISVWPKFDPGSANYDQLNAAGCFYRDVRDGSTFGNYYDAYSANCRSIYWSQIQQGLFAKYGWDAFWLDASEWEAPPGARAYVTTAAGPGVDYYNAYPLEHTRALYEGQRAAAGNTKRVFTLTRSAYAGQQRYAAASWSGDTSSSFGVFARQVTAGLNFSISGIPYWTEDIGGYYPPNDWSTPANNELFTRWFEKGVFDPVFRIHGQGARELYGSQWNAQTKAAVLAADQLRYRLMPYIYSLAGRVTRDNYTIMRPLVMDFPSDTNVYDLTDEYMFGPSLLVAPVTAAGVTSRPVYLPAGLWYDFWTGRPVTGGQTITAAAPYDHIPVYVRAGSVLPLGPASAQYAAQAVQPNEIRVYPGAAGRLALYSDAGDTYAYTTGAAQTIPLTYRDAGRQLTIGAASGSYPGVPATRQPRVVFVDPQSGTGVGETPNAPAVTYTGRAVTVAAPRTGANVGQGISVPAGPADAGRSVSVVTTVTNAGPMAARQVTTALDVPPGWTAQAARPTSTRSLAAGQTFRTSWTVTPSATAPIGTGTVTARSTYTAGGTTGTLTSPASMLVISPVQPPLRTYASTSAYFGQFGDQVAINAAGADIFLNGTSADDDYGTVYRPGGAAPESTATVRVDAQQYTDPWAKAGLVIRNDLTGDHSSAGYVILVVTPGNGVSLQWDADGDGVLDSFTSVGGPSVPVWLRLGRSGTTYTGAYSTDGSSWTTVGNTTVGSAASTQDVGLIATSHSAGQLGLDTFSGFGVIP